MTGQREAPGGATLVPVAAHEKSLWESLHLTSQLEIFQAQFGNTTATAECVAMASLFWENFRPQSRWVYLGNQLAGLIVILTVERFYFIVDFLITPTHRGQGLGTEIVRLVQAEASALNMFLLLEIFSTNHRAATFYQRLGFVYAGERPPHHRQLIWSPGGWLPKPGDKINLAKMTGFEPAKAYP